MSLLAHHSIVLLGLSSLTCSAHCIHIGVPANGLLDPSFIPCFHDLFLKDCLLNTYKVILNGPITERLFNSSTSCLFSGILSSHHIYAFLMYHHIIQGDYPIQIVVQLHYSYHAQDAYHTYV